MPRMNDTIWGLKPIVALLTRESTMNNTILRSRPIVALLTSDLVTKSHHTRTNESRHTYE